MILSAETLEYSIYNVERNLFRLDLGYKTIDLTFCQLLSIRNKVLEKSSHFNLENILDGDNFILLFVADNKHLIYLDIPQLLELRLIVLNLFKAKSCI